MKHGNLTGWALCILLAGLAGGTAAPRAQDAAEETARLKAEVARLKREIQRADEDAQRTDSLARDEQSAFARSQERSQREADRRGKENQALNDRIRDTRAKTAAERARLQGYLDASAEIAARDKARLAFFAAFADSLLLRIEAGLPWDVEARRERLLSLKRDIEAGAATSDEAFARLNAVLREEIRNGDEVSLFNRPLTRRNGETVNAQALRLGNLGAVYVDDEGKKFGVLERRVENGKASYAWREDLDFGERNAVARAVAVKGGREAPELTPLPVRFALDSSAIAKGGR